jgi:hypothetical protein
VQLRVKTVLCNSAPVLLVPLVASAPLQPPEAVHELALVEDQVKLELPPLLTAIGFAFKVIVGKAGVTDTTTDCDADPFAPMQEMSKVVVALRAAVKKLPLVFSAPLQPPDAVQDVAFVELQERVAALPLATVVGLALKVMVGSAGFTDTTTDCDAEMFAPLQEMPNVVLALSAAVKKVPLVFSAPLQPPDAVQAVAFVEVQVRVVAPPLATVIGLALIATVNPEDVPESFIPEVEPHADRMTNMAQAIGTFRLPAKRRMLSLPGKIFSSKIRPLFIYRFQECHLAQSNAN